MTEYAPAHWTLSQWLAVKTATARDSIVACIDTYQPTISDTRCKQLLFAHLQFFSLVAPIYDDTNLKRMFSSFLTVQEIASFKRQLARDVEHQVPVALNARRIPGGLLPRLGWLYATEFVDRGLTRLLTGTSAECLSLDIDPQASDMIWQAFRDQLDRLDLSECDEEKLAKSASSALVTYSGCFNDAFETPQMRAFCE
jgi:heme oxygenase